MMIHTPTADSEFTSGCLTADLLPFQVADLRVSSTSIALNSFLQGVRHGISGTSDTIGQADRGRRVSTTNREENL